MSMSRQRNVSVQGFSGCLSRAEDAVAEVDRDRPEALERRCVNLISSTRLAGRYCVVKPVGGHRLAALAGSVVVAHADVVP